MAAAHAFRTDLQGIRAVAVALVVLYHAFGAPLGGYVGVDAFFVLSGYLITRQLVGELDRTGRISLPAFALRRLRRLAPAAIVVVLTVVATAFVVWPLPRALTAADDGVAALFSFENWRLIARGANYLDASDGSPFEHFWSLAVEEQFYAFWPVLLVVATLPLTRRLLRGRGPVLMVLGVVAASMLFAAALAATSPTRGYLDSVGRVWELAAGAAIVVVPRACGARWLRAGFASSRVAADVAFGAGFVVLLVTGLVFDGTTAFPWPAALLPVSATVLLIASGARSRVAGVLFASRPVQWLGGRSYSLYLWHVPALVFAACFPGGGVWAAALGIVVAVGLAEATFRWVEQPFLRSRRSSSARPARGRRRRRTHSSTAQGLVAGAVVVATVAVAGAQLGPGPLGPGPLVPQLSAATPDTRPADTTQRFRDAPSVRAAITAGTRATGWTESAWGSLRSLGQGALAPALLEDGCRNPVVRSAVEPRTCTWGDPESTRVIAVVGDSVALTWTPAIVEAFVADGWRVEAMGYSSCTAIDVRVRNLSGSPWFPDACAAAGDRMRAFVDELDPDVVVTSSAQQYVRLLADGSTGSGAADAWRIATQRTVAGFGARGASVVVVGTSPSVAAPMACATRFTGAEACVVDEPRDARRADRAERAGVADAVRAGSRAWFVSALPWLCADGRCPLIVDDRPLRADGTHLTEVTVLALAPVIREALSAPVDAAAERAPGQP